MYTSFLHLQYNGCILATVIVTHPNEVTLKEFFAHNNGGEMAEKVLALCSSVNMCI